MRKWDKSFEIQAVREQRFIPPLSAHMTNQRSLQLPTRSKGPRCSFSAPLVYLQPQDLHLTYLKGSNQKLLIYGLLFSDHFYLTCVLSCCFLCHDYSETKIWLFCFFNFSALTLVYTFNCIRMVWLHCSVPSLLISREHMMAESVQADLWPSVFWHHFNASSQAWTISAAVKRQVHLLKLELTSSNEGHM